MKAACNGAKIPGFFRNLEKISRVSVRSRPFPYPNLELDVPNLFDILQFQRWICNSGTNAIIHVTTLKVSQSATSSANTNLMKDKIQRRLAHPRRHHSHEGDASVAVAAWAFVVITSVTGTRPSKSWLSSGPLDHAESEIVSECGHHTFRRKSRKHLPTITMSSLPP